MGVWEEKLLGTRTTLDDIIILPGLVDCHPPELLTFFFYWADQRPWQEKRTIKYERCNLKLFGQNVDAIKGENKGFTLKTHQVFSVHTTSKEFKAQQSPVILDFRLRKTRAGKSHDYRDAIIFKFLRFEERFRKAPFSWRIIVDGRPNPPGGGTPRKIG